MSCHTVMPLLESNAFRGRFPLSVALYFILYHQSASLASLLALWGGQPLPARMSFPPRDDW